MHVKIEITEIHDDKVEVMTNEYDTSTTPELRRCMTPRAFLKVFLDKFKESSKHDVTYRMNDNNSAIVYVKNSIFCEHMFFVKCEQIDETFETFGDYLYKLRMSKTSKI